MSNVKAIVTVTVMAFHFVIPAKAGIQRKLDSASSAE